MRPYSRLLTDSKNAGIVTLAAGAELDCRMLKLSYRGCRFPRAVIQHAIWLYLRFTLSYRDVEELLAERGLDVSYETVRRWVMKFGPAIARELAAADPPRTADGTSTKWSSGSPRNACT